MSREVNLSQTEREKCSVTYLICGIYKEMIHMNCLQNRKRPTDLENKLNGCQGDDKSVSLG